MRTMPNKMFRVRCADLGKKLTSRVKAGGMLMVAMFTLCGMGAAAQIVMTNSGPLTLKSGTFGSFTVTATPQGSFAGTFLIACSGLPQYAYCEYPNQNQGVTIASGTPTTVTLIVNTSQVNQYQAKASEKTHNAARVALAALFAPSALLMLVFRRRKGFGGLHAVLALALMVSLGGLSGCGSTVPASTPPGSYTFLVGASQYATSLPFASTPVKLVVN